MGIFGKKKQESAELPQDWALYFSRVDGRPASIRINLALRMVAPLEGLGTRTWFTVMLKNPDENGFTTREEYPTICGIEDGVMAALEPKGAVMAGAVKTNGALEIYLYSAAAKGYEEAVRSVMLKYEGYKYTLDFAEDAGWGDYFDFLYPSQYHYQSIQNQRIISQLEKHGDNPQAQREVDHWIYFGTEQDMEDYAAKAGALGYKVLSKKKLDEDKGLPYQLNISRMDNTVWSNVDDYVWELIELAEQHSGQYDGWGCPIAK